jgi:glycosyltransferase involved in cell wall biosynthesis
MNVLLVLPDSPLPANRGARVRDLELIRRLAPRCRLTVLCLVRSKAEAGELHTLAALVHRLEWARAPLASAPYISAGAVACFRELVAAEKPEIVQIEHSLLAPLIDALPVDQGVRSVLSLHNVATRQYRSMAVASRGFHRRASYSLKAALAHRLERRYLQRFDLAVCVSEPERDAVLALSPTARTAVVPNGVDVARLQPLPGDGEADAILFVANMEYRPNAEAARWLCNRVLRRLVDLRPGVRVRLVGPGGQRHLRGLAVDDRIELAGDVRDLRSHYAWAGVVAVPILAGGGTRLKVLEAMALGRPVVSTPLGSEGLALETEKHLLTAERPEEFAVALDRLLGDGDLRGRLSAEARLQIERRYSWDRAAEVLLREYEGVLSSTVRSTS